jgi:hypothetical protein
MQTFESDYGREPLVVDDLVPTSALRHHLGWTHVGTSDLTVAREIVQLMRDVDHKDGRWTHEIKLQTLRAGLWFHRENRAEYVLVMSDALPTAEAQVAEARRWERIYLLDPTVA